MHTTYGITIIYIFSNVLPLISTASILGGLPNKPIYDFLVSYSSKCSYLKTTKLLEPNPEYLSRCSNSSSLKSIKSLSHVTRYDILCLLYTNNYLRLCDSLGNESISNEVIDNVAKLYNLSSVCVGLSESKLYDDFKDAGGAIKNLRRPDVCNALCKELLNDSVIPICNLAAVSFKIPIAQESQKDTFKVAQVKGNIQDVSSIIKLDTAEKTGIIEGGPPMNDHKVVEDKVPSVKKPNVSQPVIQSREPVNPHVGNDEKSPGSHPDLQESQAHINNNEKVGNDTSVKANKAPVADVVEKLEIQEENPVAEVPKLKPSAGKQENQDEKHQEEVIQAPGDTQQTSPVEQVQNNQKELVVSNTDGGSMQDGKFTENNLDEDIQEIRGPDQSNDQLNMGNENDDDETVQQEPQKPVDKVKPQAKPQETDEDVLNPQFNSNSDEEDSFFFIYFMMVCAVFILGYIGYHNKQKVLALVIEGRRGRRGSRRGRPNSANYHKLDSNLEEAVTSSCNKNTTNIIY